MKAALSLRNALRRTTLCGPTAAGATSTGSPRRLSEEERGKPFVPSQPGGNISSLTGGSYVMGHGGMSGEDVASSKGDGGTAATQRTNFREDGVSAVGGLAKAAAEMELFEEQKACRAREEGRACRVELARVPREQRRYPQGRTFRRSDVGHAEDEAARERLPEEERSGLFGPGFARPLSTMAATVPERGSTHLPVMVYVTELELPSPEKECGEAPSGVPTEPSEKGRKESVLGGFFGECCCR